MDFNVREDIRQWAILDSGATSHFLVTEAPRYDTKVAEQPLIVKIPDGANIQSTHICTLAIPQLPAKAREGHIIPGLASHSLMSVVKLCNAGCEVTFTKIDCKVKYRGKVVLQGYKCTRTGLWMVPLDTSSAVPSTPSTSSTSSTEAVHHVQTVQQYAANLIPTSSREELAMYYHQCLCSPPKSTLLKAIRNNQLSSFPGLTYELIAKYLPESAATDKGHMVRTRSGTRSTRHNHQEVVDARLQVEDMNPQEQACTALDDAMFCFAILADENENTIYSDLTGRFPVQSYSGNNYIFVAYVYSINAILLRPMKNRSDASMVAVFRDIYTYLQQCGCSPKLHVLDNECSKAVQQYVK